MLQDFWKILLGMIFLASCLESCLLQNSFPWMNVSLRKKNFVLVASELSVVFLSANIEVSPSIFGVSSEWRRKMIRNSSIAVHITLELVSWTRVSLMILRHTFTSVLFFCALTEWRLVYCKFRGSAVQRVTWLQSQREIREFSGLFFPWRKDFPVRHARRDVSDSTIFFH
jgi:hypothetical protein